MCKGVNNCRYAEVLNYLVKYVCLLYKMEPVNNPNVSQSVMPANTNVIATEFVDDIQKKALTNVLSNNTATEFVDENKALTNDPVNTFNFTREERRWTGNHVGDVPTRKITVYWKYENPTEKNEKYTKSYFLEPLAIDFINKLDEKHVNANNIVEYNTNKNPYIITDKMYEDTKMKVQKDNESELAQLKEKEEIRLQNKQKELAALSGKVHIRKLNKLWENTINNEYDYIKIWGFKQMIHYLDKKEIFDDDEYRYYYVTRRQLIDGEKQKCKPSDFLINDPDFLKNWNTIKTIIKKSNGCNSMFDTRCILDSFTVKQIEDELKCIGWFNNFRTNVVNKFKSNSQEGPPAGEENKTGFLGNFFGKKKGGRTKKRNSKRKKAKRSKRSKKSKK